MKVMDEVASEPEQVVAATGHSRIGLKSALSPRRIGAVYLWIALIIIFSILRPAIFPTIESARIISTQYAISGLLALALMVPLSARLFDLSAGAMMGFSGIFVSWLLVNTDLSWPLALVVTLVVAAFIGAVNALIVVVFNIDSFIATLGTGSILSAVTLGISGNAVIALPASSTISADFAQRSIYGFTQPVMYLLILMVIIGLVLEQTKSGRFLQAIGFDSEAARLAGVRVKVLQACALITSATVAAIAGVALVSNLGTADPTVGPSYLLAGFAAAFLGATQFRNGRFNTWGTVVATLLLGTGQYGILVVGAPVWASYIFDGAVLIIAVGITGNTGSGGGNGVVSMLRNRLRPTSKDVAVDA